MWLDNLNELRKAKGMSMKQIAEKTHLPERTIIRIFSGDTYNPYVDTLHRIVSVLGGSLDCILADSKAVVGDVNLTVLQGDVNKLNGEVMMLKAENSVLQDKVCTLQAENDLLRMKLEHKEEIISLHNYYTKILSIEKMKEG